MTQYQEYLKKQIRDAKKVSAMKGVYTKTELTSKQEDLVLDQYQEMKAEELNAREMAKEIDIRQFIEENSL